MMTIHFSKSAACAAACLLAVCSCVKGQLPTGGFGRGFIEPVVSLAGETTKSSGTTPEGRYMGSFAMEGVGSDSLYISVYECDNTDLPYSLAEEAPQTKGTVVTTEDINATGRQFTINAWLESTNRYNGSQDGDGRVYITTDKDNWHIMDGVTVVRGTSGWGYISGLEYPWRNQVKTNFWSYYYVGATMEHSIYYPGNTATDEEQKHLTIHYCMAAPAPAAGSKFDDAERQGDLCLAYNTKTWSDGSDNKIDIRFHHALSAVYFSVENVVDGVSVKQIGLDDILSYGWCDVTGNPDNTPSFSWRDLTMRKNYLQDYDSASDFSASGKTQAFYNNKKIFTVLPQTLGANTSLRAKFELSDGSTITRGVNISKFEDGTFVEWKPGKKYLYKLSANRIDLDYFLHIGRIGTNSLNMPDGSVQITYSNTVNVEDGTFFIYSYWARKGLGGERGPQPVTIDYTTDPAGAAAPVSSWHPFTAAAAAAAGISGASEGYTPPNATSNNITLRTTAKTETYNPYRWTDDPVTASNVDLSYTAIGGEGTSTSQNTANCYIVKHPGTYRFPCVYGNALRNGVTNTGAFMSSASGASVLGTFLNADGVGISSPYVLQDVTAVSPKADLLWCDAKVNGELLVKNVQLNGSGSGSYISFATASRENMVQGNAVIVLYDDGRVSANNAYDEGEALWSWHIWVSDGDMSELNTGEVGSDGGTFGHHFFMNRNLGSCINVHHYDAQNEKMTLRITQSESGNVVYVTLLRPDIELKEYDSSFYQWGRKDPFIGSMFNNHSYDKAYYDSDGNPLAFAIDGTLFPQTPGSVGNETDANTVITNAVRNPMTFSGNGFFDRHYGNLWAANNAVCVDYTINMDVIWIDVNKTIYDPSPYGYRLPNAVSFCNFTVNGVNASDLSYINGEYCAPEVHGQQGFRFRNSSGDLDDNLFFPALGLRQNGNGHMYDGNVRCYYHSACPNGQNCGYGMYLTASNVVKSLMPIQTGLWRSTGVVVRPVLETALPLGTNPEFGDYVDKGDKDITF